jgi:hypothetical protein
MENSQKYKVLRKERVVPMWSVRIGEESSQEDSLEKVSLNSWMERKKDMGIYPKDCYSRGTCTSMFIAALFTIAKLWKQPRCPSTDEWIKKMWYL